MMKKILSLLLAVAAAACVYFVLIVVLKAIERQDIEAMPYGDKLVKLLGRFI